MRLNFGCGSIQPNGWVNVDHEDHGQQRIGSTELFLDNTFKVVVAHCVLQMTPHHELPQLLEELRRILCATGVLRLSLPDIEVGFDAYRTGYIDWFPNGEVDLDDRFSNWLTWYSTTRTLLTYRATCTRLWTAGFTRVRRVSFDPDQLDTREGECFFIEATK